MQSVAVMSDPVVYGTKLRGSTDALTSGHQQIQLRMRIRAGRSSRKDTCYDELQSIKHTTSRVLSIIRSSPRRGAVIDLFALNPWLPEGEENERELDYVQLMPTDAKLPMMVITVESLPGYAKKRLINDDSKEGSVCPKAQVIRMLGRAE
ncbi:unnamed protein product, partial [Musa hybrid cultivar]